MKYVEKAVPKKILSPDVDCVRYARDFCFSDDLENQTRFVWDGSHLLQEVQPDGRYIYQHRPRQLRTAGAGTQLDQRRRRNRPTSPLLPLRPNRHPKRDNR